MFAFDFVGMNFRAMDTHACVPKVQEYGCGALRNLALNCWQTSNAIAGDYMSELGSCLRLLDVYI